MLMTRRPLTYAGAHLLLVLAAAATAEAQSTKSSHAKGIAVTVRADDGTRMPAIFEGARARAAELTAGSFHFDERHPDLVVLNPGENWVVLDGDSRRRSGLAVLVRLRDGTLRPGIFHGSRARAERTSRSWSTERGTPAPSTSSVVELPVHHSRVRVIDRGAMVRTVPPRQSDADTRVVESPGHGGAEA